MSDEQPALTDAPMLRVLLLTDTAATRAELADSVGSAPGVQLTASTVAFGEGVRAVQAAQPHIAIVADTTEDPAAVVEALDASAPDVSIVAVLPEGDVSGAQACSLAGARATLLRPLSLPALLDALQQVHAREQRRRQRAAPASPAAEAREQRPRVIAIHGAKGGVGASTLAANLAIALRGLTDLRVLLVDADVLAGDVGVLLDVGRPPARTIADVLPELRELDRELLDTLLPRHESGVRVLLAPDQLPRAEAIRGEDVQKALRSLKPYFDFLVVDTPSRIGPLTVAALDEADQVHLVVTPDLLALRHAARFLQLAGQLGYPAEKVRLVLNRADAGKQITPAVIHEHLGRPPDLSLPTDTSATHAADAGQPLVTARPNTRLAQGIAQLARDTATSLGWVGTPPRRRFGFGGLTGLRRTGHAA